MDLQTAIKHVLDGNALLFLGSGFSAGANPVEGSKFLTGKELALHLSRLAGLNPPTDELNFAAQRYRKAVSDHKLVQTLQGLFTAAQVSESHRKIADLPWKAIYTTNYDDVLERAYAERKRTIASITCNLDSREYTAKKNSVVHINGFIKTLNSEELNASFKLTNTSYLTESFSKSNWSFLFRRALETCRTCIFIGYSMYDLDIQRIIFSADAAKLKTIFIERQGKTKDEILNSLQIDFGEVFPIGLDGFLEEVALISAKYIPQDTEKVLFAFEELKPAETADAFRDDYLFDLILKGEPRTQYIQDKLSGNPSVPYFIKRDRHEHVLAAIRADTKNVVIHADMANGKTLFLLGIACSLESLGTRVFWLRDDADDVAREIEYICSLESNIALVVENYASRLDELKLIQLKRPDGLILLLSAKTSSHEVFGEDLLSILDAGSTIEFELDQLARGDLPELNHILSTYKLWGERDAWSAERKTKYLEVDCDRQMSAVLLDIVKSPAVQQRFKALFDSFQDDSPTSDVMVAASVLSLLGFSRPSESVISELLNSNYLYSIEFRRNPIVKELLSLGSGSIIPRSSVLARHGLITFSDAKALIKRFIKIAENAHDLGRDSQLYFGIYKNLVTFSTLQQMLPDRGKRDALILFYEAIKNLRSAQTHPHFWLQYAIARLASDRADDLPKAKLFLDAAYAHAQKRSGYHTRHMDNVKARYLIRHSSMIQEINSALLELSDGHKLLLAQVRVETSTAPFNVAKLYLNFYNSRKADLGPLGRKMLLAFANQILEYIPKLPDHIKSERAVVHAQLDLKSMVTDITNTMVSSGDPK